MRPWANASEFASALIVLNEDGVVAAAIGNFGISGLRHGVGAFAIGDLVPGAERNQSAAMGARPFVGAFVLLRPVDVIGKLVVNIDMIELSSGLIVLGSPSLTGISRDSRTAVVALEQNSSVIRVDPHHVIVAVRGAQFLE